MPIDYNRYPPNWKTVIRPAIMQRANNKCEAEGCDFNHLEMVWAVKSKGKTTGWHRDFETANAQAITKEIKNGKELPNPKQVKVVLTIAHLDHDETNFNVSYDRLAALCQLCHLRYDAKEKYKRSLKKNK
jgi:hypothetical protein